PCTIMFTLMCVFGPLMVLSYLFLSMCLCFFLNTSATPQVYTLSLHDALPILRSSRGGWVSKRRLTQDSRPSLESPLARDSSEGRSEEHTSELQSREKLVCRLLLEKKKISIGIANLWAQSGMKARDVALLRGFL